MLPSSDRRRHRSIVACQQSQTASGTSSPIVIFGLTGRDRYTFTVTATNEVGTSPASKPSNAVGPDSITATASVPPTSYASEGCPVTFTDLGVDWFRAWRVRQ